MQNRSTTGEYLGIHTTFTPWTNESKPSIESDWADYIRTISMAFFITELLKVIISLLGMAGNAVVLCLLGFCMQRNAFFVYVLNLAGADFVYLSIQMIKSMTSFVNTLNINSIIFQQFSFMSVFPYNASLSILTAISTERCLSVLAPIWFHYHRPKYLSYVMCALLWALSLLLSMLRMNFYGYLSREYDEYLCKLLDLSIATWLIFLFVLLFGSSLVLLTKLLCGSKKMKLTRLYVTISLTVLVFLLCGLPSGMYWFLLGWIPFAHNIHSFIYYLTTEVLSCVNSCANPIIYFFVGSYRQQQRQRRSLKLILQRALQDISEEVGSENNPPQETLEMSRRSYVF